MQLVVTDLGRWPALLLLGQAPTSYVTVGQEFFFTWRELQSVIELEFSYLNFFTNILTESPTRLAHT